MSTTLTGNVKDLGVAAVAGAVVRFWLRGCGANQPRVSGTAIIAPQVGGIFFFDFTSDASGAVSGTLYSTRDSAGTGDGDIEVGGSKTAVYYGMQVANGPEVPVHAKQGATLDISNVTPISLPPVVTAPTGDTTYLRIDGGNSPVTGAVDFQGVTTVKALNGVLNAADFTGADLGAQINSAIAALPTASIGGHTLAYGQITIPAGSYTLSTTVSVDSPYISIVGAGSSMTRVSCTASVGFHFTNTAQTTRGGGGGVSGMTLTGNSSSGQIGIKTEDSAGINFTMRDMLIEAFAGTSAIGWLAQNTALWTERTFLQQVNFYENTIGISMTNPSGTNSFGHNHWIDVRFSVKTGQTAISMANDATWYSSVLFGVVNTSDAGASKVFNLAGTSQVAATVLLNFLVDNSGGGTPVGVTSVSGTSFLASGNFFGYTSNSVSGTFNPSLPAAGTGLGSYLMPAPNTGISANSAGTKAGIGVWLISNVGSSTFNHGVGFNGYFDGTNYICVGDGGSNGAAFILQSQGSNGSLKFYSVPSTGGSNQTISPATLDSTYLRGTWDNSVGLTATTAIKGTSLEGSSNGVKVPNPNGSAVFALDDSAGTLLSIANNATATPFGNADNFAGLVIFHEQSATGGSAIFLVSANTTVLVSQLGSVFSVTQDNAGTVNVYTSSNILTVQNKQGNTIGLMYFGFRTKSSH